MALLVENTRLSLQALAYVIELYNDLTQENGAPILPPSRKPHNFAAAVVKLLGDHGCADLLPSLRIGDGGPPVLRLVGSLSPITSAGASRLGSVRRQRLHS